MEHGLTPASDARFEVAARVAGGKPSRTICDVAEDSDARTIVMGARGLSRAGSVLLGSVWGRRRRACPASGADRCAARPLNGCSWRRVAAAGEARRENPQRERAPIDTALAMSAVATMPMSGRVSAKKRRVAGISKRADVERGHHGAHHGHERRASSRSTGFQRHHEVEAARDQSGQCHDRVPRQAEGRDRAVRTDTRLPLPCRSLLRLRPRSAPRFARNLPCPTVQCWGRGRGRTSGCRSSRWRQPRDDAVAADRHPSSRRSSGSEMPRTPTW